MASRHVTPNFQLTEGWNLTGFNSSVESGASAMLSSLADLAGAGADFRAFANRPAGTPPGLYRLIPDGAGGWKLQTPAIVLFES